MTSFPRPNYRPILSPRQLAALERERIKRIEASVKYHIDHDRTAFVKAISRYLKVIDQYS